MNALSFVDEAGKRAIEEAVAAAERRTSAEIVCAVASESGRYDRAEAFGGLAGSLLCLGAAHAATSGLLVASGSWGSNPGPGLVWQCLAVALGFVLGNLLLSYVSGLRRLVTSKQEMDQEVRRSASHVFADHGLSRTRGRGGLLLYLSLFERQVMVMADQGILETLGQEFLDGLRDLATAKLRAGAGGGTLLATISEAVGKLEPVLPVQPDDTDELSNELVLLHPRP